jgi:hypothetical protein
LSILAFNFHVAEPLHEPLLITSVPPPFAGADEAAANAATASSALMTPISFHITASRRLTPETLRRGQ